jgi:hypothetical protein
MSPSHRKKIVTPINSDNLANPIMNKPQHAHIYVTSLRAAANMVRFGFF